MFYQKHTPGTKIPTFRTCYRRVHSNDKLEHFCLEGESDQGILWSLLLTTTLEIADQCSAISWKQHGRRQAFDDCDRYTEHWSHWSRRELLYSKCMILLIYRLYIGMLHRVRANVSWVAVANKAAEAKKKKYKLSTEELKGSFTCTPMVCSTDAVLHREYIAYQKRLACRLASKLLYF